MKYLVIGLLAAAALAAPGRQTFTGVVSDDMCPTSHASMRMGPTDAECAIACVMAHGATYVLNDGHHVYSLSDEKASEKFAGQRVRVVGVLDAKTMTIRVESIAPAK